MKRRNSLEQYVDITVKKVEVVKTFYVVEGTLTSAANSMFEYHPQVVSVHDGKREITRVLLGEEEQLVEGARAVTEIERAFIGKLGED